MRCCLDACVLYPTILREILLGAARKGLFEPVWSPRILEEWARAAAKHGPGEEAMARGEIALIRAAWPEAEQEADPETEAALWLPDPADIHVLSTALTAQAEAIVTLNLRDFPKRELQPQGVTAIHPDAFLRDLWARHPENVADAVEAVRAEAERLSGQPQPLRPLLKRIRLPRFAKALDKAG